METDYLLRGTNWNFICN